MKLYVGNLPNHFSNNELKAIFNDFGEVEFGSVIRNRRTGESRCFGFVELDDNTALKAMKTLHGNELGDKPLIVKEAVSHEPVKRDGYGNNRINTGSFSD